MTENRRDDSAPPRPYASPPCYQEEFQTEYRSDDRTAVPPAPLTAAELTEVLNTLIEAERAGARGLIEMQPGCPDEPLKRLMHEVACDEGRFCAMLTGHVVRLGGAPSTATGVFFDKLMARETLAARMALLDRGQSAVVRMLDEMLPRVADQELAEDLQQMRDVHVQNLARCAAFEQAGGGDRKG
jgi:hypothetical protein